MNFLAIRCSSYLIIQDLVRYLGSPNKQFSVLSENMENRSEWPLASACVLVIYFESKLGKLSRLELLKNSEVYCC